MIIDRREALAAMAAVVFGGFERNGLVSRSAGTPLCGFALRASEHARADKDNPASNLSQIATHIYSEEGIPMFLGCENTVAIGVSPPAHPRSSDLNRRVSAAFEHYVQEWSRMHPHAPADDAAKLVEFLAGRDFRSGGLEASL